LYQRYIYRVDKTRINEFGTSGEGTEERVVTDTQSSITNKDSTAQESVESSTGHLKSE
jgi:hypothetical protein